MGIELLAVDEVTGFTVYEKHFNYSGDSFDRTHHRAFDVSYGLFLGVLDQSAYESYVEAGKLLFFYRGDKEFDLVVDREGEFLITKEPLGRQFAPVSLLFLHSIDDARTSGLPRTLQSFQDSARGHLYQNVDDLLDGIPSDFFPAQYYAIQGDEIEGNNSITTLISRVAYN